MSQTSQQPGYGYPNDAANPTGPAGLPAQRPTETMAILALVFAFVFAPLGIIFGVIGRKNIARNGNNGRGLATAGMWLGIVFTVLTLVYIVFIVVVVASGVSTGMSTDTAGF